MKNDFNFKPSSRRNFLRLTAFGVGTMVAVTIAGKASAQTMMQAIDSTIGSNSVLTSDKKLISTIARNHGHQFILSLTDLERNGVKSYDIQGSASHSHEIDISKDVLLALSLKNVVEIESTNAAGHTHIVRLEIL